MGRIKKAVISRIKGDRRGGVISRGCEKGG